MSVQKFFWIRFVLLSTLFGFVRGTHFRGSMISWRVVNDSSNPLIVEILQRHAWRYTRFLPLCTETTIASSQPVLGDTGARLRCVRNCPTGLSTLGSITVPCTGYNILEQYAMGESRYRVAIRQNASFVATFASTAWFDLVTGVNLDWSIAVQIQTYRRSDTNRYNQAPVVTMLPIYRLRNRISYSIKINVADNDYDPYICLWSRGTEQCGGLLNSVPNGTVDNYQCYVNFTPQTVGYYAVALTIEDFLVLPTNISDTKYLSQVPIQFIFHVYDAPDPCYRGPIYIGDLIPDVCIYLTVGTTQTTRVRFKVQCPNATVDSYISVNPTGLLTTPIQRDPFDQTIFVFLVNFTANSQQIGQNLFCFAAVDSIGNQGDSTCIRFAVESETSSLQPLYFRNSTRYPMGTVTKTTSNWTILTGNRTYTRPTIESYIRFKRLPNGTDFYTINTLLATDKVRYFSDRVEIHTDVLWLPGEQFYIHFDPGVFVEASTCLRESMPISDPTFWPFNIPYESTTTTSTSTSSTSLTSTSTTRSIPWRRTFTTDTTQTRTTTSTTSTSSVSRMTRTTLVPQTSQPFPISGIVGIILGSICILSLFCWICCMYIRITLIEYFIMKTGLRQQLVSLHSADIGGVTCRQYKLAVHSRQQNIQKQLINIHI